jgi:hypothetical protein
MRPLRALGLVVLGFYGGLFAAAALLKMALRSHGDADSNEVALIAIFGGAELESRASAFRGGSMLAWFGGVEADLRHATLAPDALLTVTALFGGVEIELPEGWRVERSTRVFGGGVQIDVPEPDDPAAPTLSVEGFAAFGGIEIKARTATSDRAT